MLKTSRFFFQALFISTALPFLPYILPFFPSQVLGFNISGWAWIIIMLISVYYILNIKSLNSPLLFFFPWILYLIFYLIIDFSSLGLQLTLQYILPFLIGLISLNFRYTEEMLIWLYNSLIKLCFLFLLLFALGYIFRGGYTPASAETPMFLSIIVSLLTGLWFITKQRKYLFGLGIIMLVPVIDVTRMGVLAMALMFALHFANRNIFMKFAYAVTGLVLLYFVFNMSGFQKKTFYSGKGSIYELSMNYYDNQNINSSGRSSWKKVLEPGLESAPLWGNGPRADNVVLSQITGLKSGEAHNDYLSVRYNYGYIGLILLLFGFLGSFLSILKQTYKYWSNLYLRLLSTSLLTLFFSFLLFMYSDNILKYTIYFPNYFFALIGIVYSIKRDEDFSNYPVVQ